MSPKFLDHLINTPPAYEALHHETSGEKINCPELRPRYGTRFRNSTFAVLAVGVIVAAAWTVAGFYKGNSKEQITDLRELVDLRGETPVTFDPDPRFLHAAYEHDIEAMWKGTMPPGRGFVNLPMIDENAPDHVISVFHQLHCLGNIQAAYASKTKLSRGESSHHEAHLSHCFDYLRQAIMCAGDTTLEKLGPIDKVVKGVHTTVMGVNGWGDTHSCRNWDAIWEFSKSNRSSNTTQVL